MKNNFLSPFHWMFAAVLFLFTAMPAWAQKSTTPPEKMPEYPGGMSALVEYFTNSLKYPEAAQQAKAEGTIIVKFTVGNDGAISDVHTVNEGATQRSDMVLEAIRVVKGMPNWTPAQVDGKAVACEMALPVKFVL
ncbi:MAG: energy transducer TonB [Lewinellaceae bacterium]|nr:energy transducer TonB [Saprospiraceae bacterium]MCB9355260.1 energy transducer TonB [Lewinellaceae bacterium]